MAETKLFLQIKGINIMYPNMENKIVVPVTKGIEIIMSIQVCLNSWKNFHFKENGGKKAFHANPKPQYHISQCGGQDCRVNNQKNGDYYEYPNVSPFSNEL